MKVLLIYSSLLVGLAFAASCSQSTDAPKPYLNITANSPVYLVDSTGGRWVKDSNVVVQMSDGSKFHLRQGTSMGYSDQFTWTADDSTDAVLHRVTFHANTSVIRANTKPGDLHSADYYPIVSSSSDFLSTLPFTAFAASK